MRLEIFVVNTEKPNKFALDVEKLRLIQLFGGLTELEDAKGFWLDSETQKIEFDNLDIWLIYTTEKAHLEDLKKILGNIKVITKQKSQAWTIDNEIFLCETQTA